MKKRGKSAFIFVLFLLVGVFSFHLANAAEGYVSDEKACISGCCFDMSTKFYWNEKETTKMFSASGTTYLGPPPAICVDDAIENDEPTTVASIVADKEGRLKNYANSLAYVIQRDEDTISNNIWDYYTSEPVIVSFTYTNLGRTLYLWRQFKFNPETRKWMYRGGDHGSATTSEVLVSYHEENTWVEWKDVPTDQTEEKEGAEVCEGDIRNNLSSCTYLPDMYSPKWGKSRQKYTLEVMGEEQPQKEVKLFMDLEYIETTKKERLFRPDPNKISPFDDVICQLKVSKTEDLSPMENSGRLITTDSDGKETEVLTGELEKVSLRNKLISLEEWEKYDFYQWKIQGWSRGWEAADVMEVLIKNGNVKCVVDVEGTDVEQEKPTKINLCVHLWGKDDAKFNILNVREETAGLTPFGFVQGGIYSYVDGFNKIDPFKEYKTKFAHYVDLKEYIFSEASYEKIPTFSKKIISENSCKNIPITQYDVFGSKIVDLAVKNAEGVFIRSIKNFVFVKEIYLSKIILHETGHAFGKLKDEYLYLSAYSKNSIPSKDQGDKNCVRAPSAWDKYGDQVYNNPGCYIWGGFYRPSVNSIMTSMYYVGKFNVVSCGYLLNRIKGGDFIENLEECMKLDVIKPGTDCVLNSDCHLSYSEGCGICNPTTNKCEFNGVGTPCWAPSMDENGGLIRVKGTCGRPDESSRGFYCIPSKTVEAETIPT